MNNLIRWMVPAALGLSVAGMMLVIAAVLGARLLVPGVVLIGIGLICWGVAGALYAARSAGGVAAARASAAAD